MTGDQIPPFPPNRDVRDGGDIAWAPVIAAILGIIVGGALMFLWLY